ncbi:MAG: malto-oligosyltrehalose synthase [Arcticibacter sp.]
MNPISTYRIQFQKEFTFEQFEQIIPYLKKLGVNTIYASPIFESTPGSTHGYDGLNPHLVNPEIGTEEKLREISEDLRENDIQWLQDIVPNHMAFDHRNPWLMDLLEKGPDSEYAIFFDSSFSSDFYKGKIMVPFLGAPLAKVLENREIKLEYRNEKFVLNYYDATYPVNSASYSLIFNGENIDATEDDSIHARVDHINSNTELLQNIVDQQFYELCDWRETDSRINFRRFFTVNGLICLNIQDEAVFNKYHEYIARLCEEGIFQGLRIDHIDGLFDPKTYVDRLRNLTSPDTYIVAEKILEEGESIPADWSLQGNSGYDFLGLVNNVFTESESEKKFNTLYQELSAHSEPVEDQIHEKKAAILFQHMSGELENLYQLFIQSELLPLNEVNRYDFKSAIAWLLIYTPVYRYYGNTMPLKKAERDELKAVFKKIRNKKSQLADAVAVLENIFIGDSGNSDQEYSKRALYFYQRCMQFTGPLMAKGVEDTLMYTYNRFVGHNEVGDYPGAFGISTEDFHHAMHERQTQWPLSINGTSTHDTKRGEDVRARLNVLTNIPDRWTRKVHKWMKINEGLKVSSRPDLNDEYLIYQTILGAWPMPGQDSDNFPERLQEYLTKALREAKVQTSWSEPNEQYEEATRSFALALLNQDGEFWKSFMNFHAEVADLGIVNSLSQLILKFTCPGVPDVYQGCELWDLSLVDPDNRRPVDFSKRAEILDEVSKEDPEMIENLWSKRYSAEIKLWLTHQLLQLRGSSQELFEKGAYIPLQVKGKYKNNILAFARRHKSEWVITAVPLHIAGICEEQQCEANAIDWRKTRIILPPSAPVQWEDPMRKASGKTNGELLISELFRSVPFAVVKLAQEPNSRSAGVLLHISSLPSAYGIGDFGSEAFHFADQLAEAKQHYWQILPLNPTEEASMHSPYSSCSSMAGNPLLISPDLLAKEGLLDEEDLKSKHLKEKSKVDFPAVQKLKKTLLHKAFNKMKKQGQNDTAFQTFCEAEQDWLNDFALYTTLKKEFGHMPWYQWPEEYKLRDEKTLREFAGSREEDLQEVKWVQFIFSRQWHALKDYCNGLNIRLFGDMPFYISYDSTDVWAHREIFKLDESGKMTGVAGVPPDYFNADGQLWGMPVFRWDVLKEQEYKWWIDRIRKNAELFDILRFDHFRAFSSYWDVPASEETARNGEWKPGPGKDFFETIERELGEIPFVAEDLGDIDQPVYDLRDAFKLPGMKVLQFAFGDDMPSSLNIPHHYAENFFVYTGTHDNNTTVGWFNNDADDTSKENLKDYLGRKIDASNVHQELARLAYASVGKTVILPLQDIIGAGADARMNSPATVEGNWDWRMLPGALTASRISRLRKWTMKYGRA